MNCLKSKPISFINKLACIIEDEEEKDSIILNIRIILFLFILSSDNLIEGRENSIKPFKR